MGKTLSLVLKELQSLKKGQDQSYRNTIQEIKTRNSELKAAETEVTKPEVGSNPGRGRGASKVETCWKCGDSDHLKKDCPVPPKKLNRSDSLNANQLSLKVGIQ